MAEKVGATAQADYTGKGNFFPIANATSM